MSRGIKWTKEEEEMLLRTATYQEEGFVNWETISELIDETFGNKRSAHATKMKWKKLQETKVVETKPQLEPWPTFWDEEMDYFLLLNFYDMTIDGLRAHFHCSYAECAGRLEYLIDSTEMAHIDLVKKAAIAVRERKQPHSQGLSLSRKEKRLMAKAEKIQAKLNQLRGVEE